MPPPVGVLPGRLGNRDLAVNLVELVNFLAGQIDDLFFRDEVFFINLRLQYVFESFGANAGLGPMKLPKQVGPPFADDK